VNLLPAGVSHKETAKAQARTEEQPFRTMSGHTAYGLVGRNSFDRSLKTVELRFSLLHLSMKATSPAGTLGVSTICVVPLPSALTPLVTPN
jgi:hypothetical protein